MDESLSREELSRRLKAARALRGIERREDLQDRLRDEYDLPHTAIAEVERGDRPLLRMEAKALADALNLPEGFFTEPEEILFNGQPK